MQQQHEPLFRGMYYGRLSFRASLGVLELSHFLLRCDFDSGDSVEFTPRFVQPLGIAELLRLHKNTAAVELQLETDDPIINGERKTGSASAQLTITFRESPPIFALVRQGWLPPPFAIPPRFLVDRNVVIALRKLRLGQIALDSSEVQWWMKFFEEGRGMFNPLPYAFEAGYQRKPTMEEFAAAYDEGVAELRKSLPKCEVVSYQRAHYQAAYAQLEASDERNAAEIEFLRQTSRLVVERVPRRREREVLRKIVGTADSLRLDRAALVVLVVISCLYEDTHGGSPSIGRRIIKPRQNYSTESAFNAINDLRHVELAAAGQTYFGENAFHLCTCDRGIAMLWCALSLRGVSSTCGAIEFTFDLTNELFPRLSDEEILELKELLAG